MNEWSQIDLVWVRVRVEWECFWVNLREDNKVSESKMADGWIQHGRIQDGCDHQVESEWMSEVFFFVQNGWIQEGMVEFKMAAIIKLSQNEWVNFFCSKWLNPRGRIQDGWHLSSWVRMNEFESDWISLSQSFVQNGWIKEGRIQDDSIQDGCHHQVR